MGNGKWERASILFSKRTGMIHYLLWCVLNGHSSSSSEPQNAIIHLWIRNAAKSLRLTGQGFPPFSGCSLHTNSRNKDNKTYWKRRRERGGKKNPQWSCKSHSGRQIVLSLHQSLESWGRREEKGKVPDFYRNDFNKGYWRQLGKFTLSSRGGIKKCTEWYWYLDALSKRDM